LHPRMTPLLEACLNGERTPDEHPAIPRTPGELATDSRAAVDAGDAVLHLHPYDEAGRQSLAPDPCAAALEAVRAAGPGTPISLSTSAAIEPDPDLRHKPVATWAVMRRELARAHGTRAGLEDATVLPAGSQPAGNAELVRTAAELIAQFAQDSP